MNNYLESIAMTFDFNNLAPGQGQGPLDLGTASPTSPNQHDPPSHQPSISSSSSGNVTVYQTTGPDAFTSPILAPGGSGQPALNPRSCVTCRKRKVRCDKQMPCSNCRRAQIPCVFPAPGRAPRQPRPKDPNAPPKNSSQRELELMKRLRKLEGIVEDLSGQIEVESGGKNPSASNSPDDTFLAQQSSSAEKAASYARKQLSGSFGGPASGSPQGSESASDQSEAARKKDLQQQFGRLVLNDQSGSKRYVSSGFWTKINDELDSIREETQRLTDEATDESDPETTAVPNVQSTAVAADHHAFILGYRSADVNLRQCHPSPSHVSYLWDVYKDNVEPLLRLLHVPTMEAIFRDARKNPEKLSMGHQALVFAIYYAAITSLEPEEVATSLGAKRNDLLGQYRFAVEQALSKANFLNTSQICVIQAFTLFLVIVRRHDESRFCWSLTGLLVHLAQGLGLHRDGSHFGLSPLETEIRRRIWWDILVLDLRSAEELGTDLIVSEMSYDTQKPSNINDVDIGPDTVEFPEPKEGRSDTAVALVRYEICGLARRLLRASSAAVTMCPKAGASSLEEREQMLIDVYKRVESRFLHHVLDERDPLYWMIAIVARVIMAKMCLVIYQPMLFPGSEYQLSDEVRQRIYVASIEIMEYNHILSRSDSCKQYRWLFQTYTAWHAIGYVLIETCRRPWTALVERGWEALNGYERDPVEYAKTADHSAVFMPLRKLFMRARRHRAAELARLKADPEEARRLDLEERMNPAQARFGPVPGTEKKMDDIRQQWRALVRAEGASPMRPIVETTPPAVSGITQAPLLQPSALQLSQPQQPDKLHIPASGDMPNNLALSDAAMDLMDDLMTQNNSFTMTSFWPMQDPFVADIKNSPSNTAAGVDLGMVAPASQGQLPQQNMVSQQQIAAPSQPPVDDHLPPYFWTDPSHPWTAPEAKFDHVGVEDTDMLGDDFDWQNWTQKISGLEMESAQQGQAPAGDGENVGMHYGMGNRTGIGHIGF